MQSSTQSMTMTMKFHSAMQSPAERSRAYRARVKAKKNHINQKVMIKTAQQSPNRLCRTCDDSNSAEIFKLHSCPKKFGGLRIFDMLKEVTKINTEMEKTGQLPQFICSTCLHKLKNAYDFVIQARRVNKEMMDFPYGINTMCVDLNEICNESSAILKIKEESFEDFNTQNEFLTDDEYNYNEYNDSLSSLAMTEANEREETASLKVTNKKSNISKSKEFQPKSESLESFPIEVYTVQSSELIIKEEPCEFDTQKNDIESLGSLVMKETVRKNEAHNGNLELKKEDTSNDNASTTNAPVFIINGEAITSTIQLQYPHCERSYIYSTSNMKHMPSDEYFLCSLCGQKKKSAKDLRTHMGRHKFKYKCDICGMAFTQNQEMLQHRIKHT